MAALGLALALAACATIPRFEAAGDVHAFLVAIRDGDRAAFDSHVDRSALKQQLRSRVLADLGKGGGAGALGGLLAGPLVDAGVDVLVRPDVFRAVAIEFGYAADKPLPGVFAISQFVRPLEGDRACVFTKRDGPCVLIFRREEGTYRLIGFEGRLELGPGGRPRLAS